MVKKGTQTKRRTRRKKKPQKKSEGQEQIRFLHLLTFLPKFGPCEHHDNTGTL